MNNYEHLTEYLTAVFYFKKLLNEDIISNHEYNVIDTNIAKYYGISLSSIFRDFA